MIALLPLCYALAHASGHTTATAENLRETADRITAVPYRVFVVQFRRGTNVARGCVTGRVEHVVSGQATHFASVDELLAFIGQVLTTVRAPP